MTERKLQIPYRSQWDKDGKDHTADCGPTSVAMLLNGNRVAITPDELQPDRARRRLPSPK